MRRNSSSVKIYPLFKETIQSITTLVATEDPKIHIQRRHVKSMLRILSTILDRGNSQGKSLLNVDNLKNGRLDSKL